MLGCRLRIAMILAAAARGAPGESCWDRTCGIAPDLAVGLREADFGPGCLVSDVTDVGEIEDVLEALWLSDCSICVAAASLRA